MSVPPDPSILERNLRAIGARSPKAARTIMDSAEPENMVFETAPDGAVWGSIDGVTMCSKRAPITESRRWASDFDPKEHGFLGVCGFSMGHHVRALSEAHNHNSLIVCLEPDAGLMRAVLSRVDHSDWIAKAHLLVINDEDDRTELARTLKGLEAFMATGVRVVEHRASLTRIGDRARGFESTILEVVKTMRMHLVTVLAHAGMTLRNIIMNTNEYSACAGIDALEGSCAGRPAICVAAGPSLVKNLALLEDPSVRERCVIIAVQTMLKPLLERGIKPHFVTALDHHEISRRFYEGLTSEDVEGVRLVAEPKGNGAIFDSYPGEILCTNEDLSDRILGEELARPKSKLRAGSTVAHLNFYLAEFLGCTDIVLIGQDLGFSDNQYYAPGASIHSVWGAELSEHRTLEMMEWERIARMKGLLHERTDVRGEPIFTDEQMRAYIAQFESDFEESAARGVRVIDATEGGVRLAHTQIMDLSGALGLFRDAPALMIPETSGLSDHSVSRRERTARRIGYVSDQTARIEDLCDRALKHIDRAIKNAGDRAKVDSAIEKIHKVRDEVTALEPGYGITHFINQRGTLERFKADRLLSIESDLEPDEITRRRLERDRINVRSLKESASAVRRLLDRAKGVCEGTCTKLTRDESADEHSNASGVETSAPRRVDAIIFADPVVGPLGVPRDLSRPIKDGRTALDLTIERLSGCERLDGITIITPEPDRIAGMISGSCPVRIVRCASERLRERARSIGKSRASSSDSWRGSIGNLTCYDEGLDPIELARVMEENGIDAGAIVGPDWALVDPQLVDRIVARFRADPERVPISFSQAAPGFGCFVIDRDTATKLAQGQSKGNVHATIGGLISYHPHEPKGDPIAKSMCVDVHADVRDVCARVAADTKVGFETIAEFYHERGDTIGSMGADEIARSITRIHETRSGRAPSRLVIELCTGRLSSGVWGRAHHTGRELDERPLITLAQSDRLIRDAVALRDDVSVLFSGVGDPLMRPDALDFVSLSDELGAVCTELRTDLLSEYHSAESIVDSGLGVLSVDVLSDSRVSYERMTGLDRYDAVLDRIQALFDARGASASGVPTPWIVPRMTKCSDTLKDMINFYDRWLLVCGCAVIDAPRPGFGDGRISALPIPAPHDRRIGSGVLRVRSDGTILDSSGAPVPETNVFEIGVEDALRRVRSADEMRAGSSAEIKPAARDGAAA